MPARKNAQYKDGELELILSLAPTAQNIRNLSSVLDRSEDAVKIVYEIAYQRKPFGTGAGIQVRKILAAKQAVGIVLGRKSAARNEPISAEDHPRKTK